MSRNKKTSEVIEIILMNLRQGMTRDIACTQAGIARQTLHRWCDEDAELSADVEAAIDVSKAVLLNEIKTLGEARQDWRAAAWLLERRWPHEFGAKRDLDVTINKSDGSDVVVSMVAQAQQLIAEQNAIDEESDE
jgi:transposase